ncbi:DUF7091 family protein [Halorientalis pallida]|uniref:Uncharacterized protein n=1 Tax=Halorientalis pallida TaxID=2479928 RepID=A0A498KZ23_9EURY|nr:hypothetical protein [Halorientalis pallida]RXK50538.1 hypothetical protein EAF64_08300 [Halorientalis pallida]
MDEDGRLHRFVENLRSAGDQFAAAKRAYSDAKRSALADLPQDERGRAKIVCRRYAEKRAVALDGAGRPDCFDPDHTDCQGCVEDVREGVVETW